jgi:hypothetical protein
METESWKDIKDTVYGKHGAKRRDELERDMELFRIRLFSVSSSVPGRRAVESNLYGVSRLRSI